MRSPCAPVLLLLLTVAALGACSPADVEGPRTVLLVSIDTLRPGRLGTYGGDPAASPRLDALAGRSVVFEQALSTAPWTLPSHMSMLTGLDPVAHGVKRGNVSLSKHVETLAEVMAAAGFETAAFTDGGFVSGAYGFSQGFGIYEDKRDPEGPNGFARILPRALDWMGDHSADDYLLFVHTFDVHAPYDEGDPDVMARFRERGAEAGPLDHRMHWTRFFHQQNRMGMSRYGRISELLNDYDAGVFEADRGVGALLDALEQAGRLENALVIVTSDHGETIMDRGLHVGHGIGLTDDELAIPLIVRFPGDEYGGQRSDVLTDLVDIAPTVIDTMGLDAPSAMQGDSLHAMLGGARPQRDFVLAHSINTESYALIREDRKYITPLGLHAVEVAKRHLGVFSPTDPARLDDCIPYDLRSDPEADLCYDIQADPLAVRDHLPHGAQLFDRRNDEDEVSNLAEDQPELAQQMLGYLMEQRRRSEALYAELFDMDSEPPPFDPHQEQQLAQLGYLDTGAKADFIKMSKAMRDELKDPHTAPDMAGVEAIDREVHEMRLAVRDGSGGPEMAEALNDTALRYVEWAVEHDSVPPQWWPRIAWRLYEVKALGAEVGVTLDDAVWWQHSLELRGMPADAPRGKKP